MILEQYKELLKSSNSDVNLVYPTINAYFRHRRSGIFELLAATQKTQVSKSEFYCLSRGIIRIYTMK